MVIRLLLALSFLFVSPKAEAQAYSAPWVVLADSITTSPSNGADPRTLQWPIITQSRGVAFTPLGGPGAAIGGSALIDYGSTTLPDDITRACGYLYYCAGVIVQAGVNDWVRSVPWNAQAASYTRIMDWAQATGRKVLMIELIFDEVGDGGGSPNNAGNTLDAIRGNRYLMCAARPTVCIYVPRPANEFRERTAGYYISDGRHLTVAGRRAYATWIEGAAVAAGLF